MLHRDVFVLEPIGLPGGVLDQAGEPLGDEHLTGRRTRTGNARPAAQLGLHVLAQPVRIRPCAGKQGPDQALALVQQCQSRCSPSTSVWPKRSALVCASCNASCDFWSSGSGPSISSSGSVAPLQPLELRDPIEQVDDQAERGVVRFSSLCSR